MKTKITFVLAGLVTAIVLTSAGSARAATWTQKADMPTARNWLSTSVVDGKVYAIGGLTVYGGTDLATVEVYDPVTDTWTPKADMPTPRNARNNSVQTVRSPGISRANADYLISNVVKILTLFERAVG